MPAGPMATPGEPSQPLRDHTALAPAPSSRHDLSQDEARGGHTLTRHVGRTDQQLRERLRQEPSLSVASTYTDRPTAEITIAHAMQARAGELARWTTRRGKRPDLAVDYTASSSVGRSLRRGATASTPCVQAVVVLRWDIRHDDSYVLTSYPDCRR